MIYGGRCVPMGDGRFGSGLGDGRDIGAAEGRRERGRGRFRGPAFARKLRRGKRGRGSDLADVLELGGEVTFVAVGEGREAEVVHAVEFVEGDAHVETDFGGGQAIATGLLHDGEAVEIEPADGAGIESAN